MDLDAFDAILLDMDGTLYREGAALPGAAEFLDRLERQGPPYRLITNNAAQTPDELADRLARLGLRGDPARIVTAGQAIADRIRDWPAPRRVCNFAGPALEKTLRGEATWVEGPDEPCDVVAVSSYSIETGSGFDYARAQLALQLLVRGATLLVGCPDRTFPVGEGLVEFGSGAIGAMLAYAAEVPADRVIYAGKPQPEFFRRACEPLGAAPGKTLVIGDNLDADIAGARELGMTTLLLLCGVTSTAPPAGTPRSPHAVAADLDALLAPEPRVAMLEPPA